MRHFSLTRGLLLAAAFCTALVSPAQAGNGGDDGAFPAPLVIGHRGAQRD